jgi:diadenosine tetraphosphatase ApaH/serine/threonine PP2A family protein phosphatase
MHVPSHGETIIVGFSRLILNPGSVGQPRDSDARASYAIYDDKEEIINFRRVEYNISKTQELMRQYKLPQRLVTRLDYGL